MTPFPSVKIWIVTCIFLGIAVVLIMNKVLPDHVEYGGGFERKFRNEIVLDHKVADLTYNSYYIAGTTSDRVYLGNYSAPRHLISISTSLEDTAFLTLKLPSRTKFIESGLQVSVYFEKIFASETLTPAILEGIVNDWQMECWTIPKTKMLSAPAIISSTSFVAKSYDPSTQKSILTKISMTAETPSYDADVLEKQIDGLFCTDGFIVHDPLSARLVYIYYYRNEFICLDTSLQVLYRAHTIDTVSKAHLKVSMISSEKTRTLSAPPVVVNKRGFISNEKIYIHSALISDHEDRKSFEGSFVIDVYFSLTGRYSFSFYLPQVAGNSLNSLSVTDNAIYTIQDHFLVSYSIR